MAKRYGVLPSYLLRNGDTIDMMCAELGQAWENEQARKVNEAQNGVKSIDRPQPTQEEMLAMVERAKNYEQNRHRS